MKAYRGAVTESGCVVEVHEDGKRARDLDPRLDVRNHSSTGFAWGYVGSGPSQLALALCLDALNGDVERATAVYHAFKRLIIAGFPGDQSWSLEWTDVLETIAKIESALADRYVRPLGVEPF